uniref:Uncharacterized protein n=1 Tax=Globodera rostochiensis TaxID=31243 RepID=A0A914H691_GLORO
MEKIWILILVSFFATNSLDKAESVQLEELPLQTFDELFVEEWWDNEEAEDLQRPPTIFGQIEHNSTDQNPPRTESDHFGQIEHNSTDQNPPLTESDHFGQIEPNSTDQNLPLTESDHFDNAKNGEEQNEIKKVISSNEKIAEDERKQKFDQRKAELTRDGFKGSYKELDKTVAKELGLSFTTICNWKRELGQTKPTHKYSRSEQTELMKTNGALPPCPPRATTNLVIFPTWACTFIRHLLFSLLRVLLDKRTAVKVAEAGRASTHGGGAPAAGFGRAAALDFCKPKLRTRYTRPVGTAWAARKTREAGVPGAAGAGPAIF